MRKAALLAPALFLAACRQPPPPAHLGVAVPLTGDLAQDGLGIQRAVLMAVDEARKGGALPAPLEVVSFDDKADPEEAAKAAAAIAADPAMIAVIGHLTSGCSLSASKVYAAATLAMITPSATAPELTLQQTRPQWSGPRVVFRVPPSDAVQGAFGADFAFSRFDWRRVAVVHDKTAYGQGLAQEFRRAFEAKGGRIVAFEGVSRGDKDFGTLLERVKGERPDGLFFGGVHTEAGLLLRQSRALAFKVPFMSGDGAKTADLFTVAGHAADGAYFTVSGVPVEHLPSAAGFVARYKARYGAAEPRVFDHYGYEAALILLEAFRKAGPDREKLLDALRLNRHEGMIGTIVFDGKGDSLKSLITMTRASYEQKSFEPVY